MSSLRDWGYRYPQPAYSRLSPLTINECITNTAMVVFLAMDINGLEGIGEDA
jgi:hypothetical protein